MKDVLSFLQGSGKTVGSPLFLLAVLFLAVLVLVYFMNEGYVDASGTKLDASGNLITLSLSDLIKALTFSNKADSTDVLNPPVFSPATNVLPVTVAGGSLSSESENRIAQNVAKNLKDEWLAKRSTTPVIPGEGCPADGSGCSGNGGDSCSGSSGGSCGSPSCCQGADYSNSVPAPFNSSDYIRKDSIPCWGCTPK